MFTIISEKQKNIDYLIHNYNYHTEKKIYNFVTKIGQKVFEILLFSIEQYSIEILNQKN